MSQDRLQNDDSRQSTSGQDSYAPTPGIANILSDTNRSLDKVRVVHGAHDRYFDHLSGMTVAQVRKSLRDVFNIPTDAEALVDGKQVDGNFILHSGQNLEFNKEAGVKGSTQNRSHDFFMWLTLIFFVLMILSGCLSVFYFMSFRVIAAALTGIKTLIWGVLYKFSLNRYLAQSGDTIVDDGV